MPNRANTSDHRQQYLKPQPSPAVHQVVNASLIADAITALTNQGLIQSQPFDALPSRQSTLVVHVSDNQRTRQARIDQRYVDRLHESDSVVDLNIQTMHQWVEVDVDR